MNLILFNFILFNFNEELHDFKILATEWNIYDCKAFISPTHSQY